MTANGLKIGIVGAGVMGLSAAWALAKRGARVSVFEQYPIPNPLGSSVDQHRLIRYPYGDQTGYCRMVDAAFDAWDRLWADLGEKHYAETGTLGLDGGGGDWAARSAAGLRDCNIAFEILTPAEVTRRFPHLHPDGIDTAFYEPRGGALFADRIVAGLARHLAARGAALHANTRISAIDPDRARLTLGSGKVEAFDRLVIAAGPWIVRLVPELAPRVTASRQLVAYLDPPAAERRAWDAAPMVIEFRGDYAYYLVPPRAGTGFKIGDHRFTLAGDPDRDRVAAPGEVDPMLEAARLRLRNGGAYRLIEAKTCFYDVEPQERFILEPLGAAGYVMSGFSGHGFKFGPLMGELAAASMLGETDAESVRRYAAGEGMPLP